MYNVHGPPECRIDGEGAFVEHVARYQVSIVSRAVFLLVLAVTEPRVLRNHSNHLKSAYSNTMPTNQNAVPLSFKRSSFKLQASLASHELKCDSLRKLRKTLPRGTKTVCTVNTHIQYD